MPSRSTSPRTSSVEPPPMSTTSTGPQHGLVGERPHQHREGQHQPALAPRTPPQEPPRAALGHRVRGRRRRSRRQRAADVAQKRSRGSTWCERDEHRELLDRREQPLESLVGESAGAVDALPELTIRDSRTSSAASPVAGSRSAEQQLDGVRAAVERAATGRVKAGPPPRPTRRPCGPPVAEPVEHLVAQRVDAAALHDACAASTWERLTRVGIPPAEMPSISGTPGRSCGRARRAPRGSARAPRR